jgi:hypothetical protein
VRTEERTGVLYISFGLCSAIADEERQSGVSIACFNKGNTNCKRNKAIHGEKSGEVWEKRRGSHVECGARLGVR